MGLFLHVVLFPGGDEAACRAALEREYQRICAQAQDYRNAMEEGEL